MFCTKCGKQVPDGAAFCTGCGNPLDTVKMQAVGTESNVGADINIPPTSLSNTADTPSTSRNNKGKIIALTIVAVLAVALIMVCAVFLVRGYSPKDIMTRIGGSADYTESSFNEDEEVYADVSMERSEAESDEADADMETETELSGGNMDEAITDTDNVGDSNNDGATMARKPGEIVIAADDSPENNTRLHTDDDSEIFGYEADDDSDSYEMNGTNNDFILPYSDTRLLTESDLRGLTAEECRIARNEIYARHGRKFADEELQAYFNSKDWYRGTIEPNSFSESMLSDIETANRDKIVEYEKKAGYR